MTPSGFWGAVEESKTECAVIVAQQRSYFLLVEQSAKSLAAHYRQVVLRYQFLPKQPDQEVVRALQIGDANYETPTGRQNVKVPGNDALHIGKMFDEPVGHNDIEVICVLTLKRWREEVALDYLVATYTMQFEQLS